MENQRRYHGGSILLGEYGITCWRNANFGFLAIGAVFATTRLSNYRARDIGFHASDVSLTTFRRCKSWLWPERFDGQLCSRFMLVPKVQFSLRTIHVCSSLLPRLGVVCLMARFVRSTKTIVILRFNRHPSIYPPTVLESFVSYVKSAMF